MALRVLFGRSLCNPRSAIVPSYPRTYHHNICGSALSSNAPHYKGTFRGKGFIDVGTPLFSAEDINPPEVDPHPIWGSHGSCGPGLVVCSPTEKDVAACAQFAVDAISKLEKLSIQLKRVVGATCAMGYTIVYEITLEATVGSKARKFYRTCIFDTVERCHTMKLGNWHEWKPTSQALECLDAPEEEEEEEDDEDDDEDEEEWEEYELFRRRR